jgi:hypothetical protein
MKTLIMHKTFIIIIFSVIFSISGFAVSNPDSIPQIPAPDSTGNLTPESASGYIGRIVENEQLWKSADDALKRTLKHLLLHYHSPIDSIRNLLETYDFDGLSYDTVLVSRNDTLPLRWLNDSLFFVDTVKLDQWPVVKQKTIVMKTVEPDSAMLKLMDSIPDIAVWIDSVVQVRDTITKEDIDFDYLASKNIQLIRTSNGETVPPLVRPDESKFVEFTTDSSKLIFTTYSLELIGSADSPFHNLPDGHLSDSLHKAVQALLDFTWQRDSVQLFLSSSQGKKTPFWLTSRKSDLYRYWLKNSRDDSITVWIGNPTKYSLSMALEERVHVERMGTIPANDVTFTTSMPDLTPAPIRPLKAIPVFWSYGFNGSFSINQNYITYWAQGAESSFAGLLDLNGNAKYTNKAQKTEWINSGRLRFGSINTKENGFRVNSDILELNSQFNKILANKLDFSSVFYFKTQIAKGYNYPNDSVAISKFLNPGTFTIGIGAEYKPFENTLINFSPISYKNTFVLDTAEIDQTAHGIEINRKTRQEIGGQVLIKNDLTLFEELKVSNTLRLFSNYADKPQNVDVDWEMTMERRISWIFSVKLNIHLIYDDDILFTVDLPEGGEKKAPRTQFNQFLGLSISLNL